MFWHPYCRLGDMRVPDCRFYDSKMRPLLLVYDNPDTSSVLKDVRIMFKNGDGQCEHIIVYCTAVLFDVLMFSLAYRY